MGKPKVVTTNNSLLQSMSHDVQALQSQVDNLKSENVRLQEQYPGARAKGVSDQLVGTIYEDFSIVYRFYPVNNFFPAK